MSLLLLAAATALAAPVSKTRNIDYPDGKLETSAAIRVEIVVDPSGKTQSCEVLEVYGDPELAGKLCRAGTKAGFKPARDAKGEATHGVVRTFLAMVVPGTLQGSQIAAVASRPDMEVMVKSMPGGAASADVLVSLQVDGSGAVVGCAADANSKAVAALKKVACAEASKQMLNAPKNQTLASYVTSMVVRFSQG